MEPADGGSGWQILLHDCVSALTIEMTPAEVVLTSCSPRASSPWRGLGGGVAAERSRSELRRPLAWVLPTRTAASVARRGGCVEA